MKIGQKITINKKRYCIDNIFAFRQWTEKDSFHIVQRIELFRTDESPLFVPKRKTIFRPLDIGMTQAI